MRTSASRPRPNPDSSLVSAVVAEYHNGVELNRMHRSRALSEAGYDSGSGTLRVRFHHGGLYDYFDVPAEVYAGLRTSAHPWTEWGDHITSTYTHERLE